MAARAAAARAATSCSVRMLCPRIRLVQSFFLSIFLSIFLSFFQSFFLSIRFVQSALSSPFCLIRSVLFCPIRSDQSVLFNPFIYPQPAPPPRTIHHPQPAHAAHSMHRSAIRRGIGSKFIYASVWQGNPGGPSGARGATLSFTNAPAVILDHFYLHRRLACSCSGGRISLRASPARRRFRRRILVSALSGSSSN